MRPIDADEVIWDLMSLKALVEYSEIEEAYDRAVDDCVGKIKAAPALDVKPVVHAHWIPYESETGEGSNTYKCSACGEIQMLIDGTPKENGWAYCPNCGAKMDASDKSSDKR
ncbi:hypothetical protein ACTNEN_09665 [Oribacterium sp. HCP28S3_H8]|uniref:hypothetical protein n=1 Tax=Oribacterium sp. HCP28S3_H8 TaxID=3438945 RepID=UPI003F88ABFD